MPTATYPETRYAPIRPVNLSSKDERARLSASALRGFFRLVKRWSLRDEDAKQLLGGVTNGPYYEMKKHPDERVLWIVPTEPAHEKTITWLRSMNLTASADFYIAPRYAAQVHDDALVAKIDNHPPTHVVVGIGGGVQEKLGLFLKENLRARPAIHCIGAALAFLTGDQPPIPMWADRFYLGWLLRLLRQPRIFGPRYLSALKLPGLLLRYGRNLPPLAAKAETRKP